MQEKRTRERERQSVVAELPRAHTTIDLKGAKANGSVVEEVPKMRGHQDLWNGLSSSIRDLVTQAISVASQQCLSWVW